MHFPEASERKGARIVLSAGRHWAAVVGGERRTVLLLLKALEIQTDGGSGGAPNLLKHRVDVQPLHLRSVHGEEEIVRGDGATLCRRAPVHHLYNVHAAGDVIGVVVLP
eukprot:CAMPEP_0196743910 /NCGR_PEP_ID=MMETSP1091-20130531/55041_1 /TAXON_ID=302021 /ORGANISM="Rhodomonas sp., Strain CCMP768" /LENGTH=108 /DNA_ID=CAMNT_0042090363 /DNA_START=180 /DNA_END=507 /DNA_ORIENTATION=+